MTAAADATADATAPEALTNLASSANRACVLFATDEWFATAENLLNPSPPTFVPDLFCAQGKVMDGWETRRRRTAGHDWCVVRLCDGTEGAEGFDLKYVELDTAYFTGNQTPRVSIEAMRVTRPRGERECENDDYLYDWMPGAAARLARGGGEGVRGTGQSPAAIENALEACRTVARNTLPSDPSGGWITILPRVELRPGYEESRYHSFEIAEEARRRIRELGGATHLKLNYYPDGGVARMKVFGRPCLRAAKSDEKDGAVAASPAEAQSASTIHPHSSSDPPPSSLPYPHIELSSELHGGVGLACSNKHYGVPSNLLRPQLGKDMGDGWETARHPDRPAVVTKDPATGLQDTELMDWSVIKLGMGGARDGEGVSRVIVDTRHFKGNFPESVSIDGCYAADGVTDEAVCTSAGETKENDDRTAHGVEWFPLLERTPLTADAEHVFLREDGRVASGRRGATHARISIRPDGGLSRVRIYGVPRAPRSHL